MNTKAKEALANLIRESIKAELKMLNEGTVEGTVLAPLVAAIAKRDQDAARKIFRLSFDQFSPEEIQRAIQKKILSTTDENAKYILAHIAKEYMNKGPKGDTFPKPGKVESQFEKDKIMAGANQASIPATRSNRLIAEGALRAMIVEVLKELAPGLRQGTSAGLDARVAKMKAASDAKKTVGNQAPKVNAPAAPVTPAVQDKVDNLPPTGKVGAVPPPVPADAKKKQAATPPPVPTPNYAGQVKKVALSEEIIRNLVRAIIAEEMKK